MLYVYVCVCVLMQGTPMADLLTWNNATVTLCHSKTVDLETMSKRVG